MVSHGASDSVVSKSSSDSGAVAHRGQDSNRHGFMTYILCCPTGTADKLAAARGEPPSIFTGDWMETDAANGNG